MCVVYAMAYVAMLMSTTMVTMCIMYRCVCCMLLASGVTPRIGAAGYPSELSATFRGGAHSKHSKHVLQRWPLGLALSLRQAPTAGTDAGEARSREYNEAARLYSMRHAMRDMLRKPPAGFEPAVRAHFRLVRPLLERQCARWLSECTVHRAAMEKCYTELLGLLDALDAAPAAGAAPGGSDAAPKPMELD